MENQYHIKEVYVGGIHFFEVWGDFTPSDLFDLIGKHQYMCTFVFKDCSQSFGKYGSSVTGLMFYGTEQGEGVDLGGNSNCHNELIRIDSPMLDMSQNLREDLKYGGLPVTDINYLCFSPFKLPTEYLESGEKKVPNIITIPYEEDSRVDVDILYQNYIALKNNSKTELTQFEKDKFIGITLAINDRRIDSRLLLHLGYDVETLGAYNNLWYHFYKTKERRKTLSDEDMEIFHDLKIMRQTETIIKLLKEIKKSGVSATENSEMGSVFQLIISSLKDFEPEILLHGKKQIFWDIDSYLHIVMRHVKQLQIGRFKSKTPFPYKFEDLETLIGSILRSIGDEIKRHFEERQGKDFRRNGKMSILFNGDYYCVHIDKDGKLLTLYAN